MRTLLTLAALLLAAPLFGQTRNDLDAQAALELQKAKASAKVPSSLDAQAKAAIVAAIVKPEKIAAPESVPLSLEEAVAWTAERHKPVLVRVGAMDCSSLCKGLRPEIPTCHTATMYGSGTPRILLMLQDQAGVWWQTPAWTKLPTEKEVREAAADLKKHTEPKVVPQPVTYAPAFAVPCRT